MKRHAVAVSLIMTLVSFLGFWVENLWLAIAKGYMDNRNMHFPFLFGYGLAILAIFTLFGTPKKPKVFGIQLSVKNPSLRTAIYFGIIFLCVSIGEWILGTIVEKTCGIVWWNYSKLPLHISKYTSVPTSIGFSFLITVFMKFLFEPLYRSFYLHGDGILKIAAWFFLVVMILDFVYSAIWMFRSKTLLRLWKWNMAEAGICLLPKIHK